MAGEEVEEEVPDAEPPAKVAPVKEPRSPLRKFVYLLVALSPFVAFVLLLPRGGEVEGEDEEPSPTPSALVTPRSVQLAFPYDFSQVVETPDPPEVVEMQEPTRQCNDGVDNDRDRRIDYPNDSGCSSRTDNSEANVVARTSAPPPPPPPPSPSAPSPSPSSQAEPPPTPDEQPGDADDNQPPDCNDPVDRLFPPCNNNNNDDDDDNEEPPPPPDDVPPPPEE